MQSPLPTLDVEGASSTFTRSRRSSFADGGSKKNGNKEKIEARTVWRNITKKYVRTSALANARTLRRKVELSMCPTRADPEHGSACKNIIKLVQMRDSYSHNEIQDDDPLMNADDPFAVRDVGSKLKAEIGRTEDGCLKVIVEAGEEFAPTHTLDEFAQSYKEFCQLLGDGPLKSFCSQRLKLLEKLYHLHVLYNQGVEEAEGKRTVDDFCMQMKVDNHIHLAAAMSAKSLLDFMKRKFQHHAGDVIGKNGDIDITLGQIVEEEKIVVEDLDIDRLDVRADATIFDRFDRFNGKYNPCGNSRLRSLFLKTDNEMGGRYFAEMTKELLRKTEDQGGIGLELRVSIYGRKKEEWGKLGKWVSTNKVYSHINRWIVQVPRIYPIYKKLGDVSSFQDMLDNIFMPLFEVSIDPSSDPDLHAFLLQTVAFDSVDDESKPEGPLQPIPPSGWTSDENPPYAYYSYYMHAHIAVLNSLRAKQGLNTFSFRPHCGESGDVNHLVCAFLHADGVIHGINLSSSPVLQYLFYLTQIGCSVSPLSNNCNGFLYEDNPFFSFFKRGLNVALATDAPLVYHRSQQPLLEEYCTAEQIWKLSMTDLGEVARNSVLLCGFEAAWKDKHLGATRNKLLFTSFDGMLLNVSPERLSFREEALQLEIEHLAQLSERHLFVRETGYESNYKPAKEDSADHDTPLASERRSTRMSVLTGLEQQLVERIEQEATAPAAGDAGTSLSKDEEVGEIAHELLELEKQWTRDELKDVREKLLAEISAKADEVGILQDRLDEELKTSRQAAEAAEALEKKLEQAKQELEELRRQKSKACVIL